MRKEYKQQTLSENELEANPFTQFGKWWHDATTSEVDEINAMTLATVKSNGVPSSRTVLLKGFDERGFVFFTNYNSNKGIELEQNSNACLVFFWAALERQVRITGKAEKISTEESIAYFNSRPEGSKIGAWASPQSLAIAGKAWLKETFDYYRERFKHGEIPKPPHWGGYRIIPAEIEFWQGRPSRLHDRFLYTQLTEEGSWKIERLAP
ncbi:MAG: pyridoxamine 5'-phosphate oxidase [Chitinophagaceae bacterium]|nr:pyridoxamine 5'-phosphate oxidase [Chitinophagaceae bacterium]